MIYRTPLVLFHNSSVSKHWWPLIKFSLKLSFDLIYFTRLTHAARYSLRQTEVNKHIKRARRRRKEFHFPCSRFSFVFLPFSVFAEHGAFTYNYFNEIVCAVRW
mgnify:CR=1 FL=1